MNNQKSSARRVQRSRKIKKIIFNHKRLLGTQSGSSDTDSEFSSLKKQRTLSAPPSPGKVPCVVDQIPIPEKRDQTNVLSFNEGESIEEKIDSPPVSLEILNVFSDSEDDEEECIVSRPFKTKLREWAIQNIRSTTNKGLTHLLKILREEGFHNLPQSANPFPGTARCGKDYL